MLTRRIAPVLLLGILTVAHAQTPNDGGHSFSVKLLDSVTGKPVKNVWVLPRELREPSRFGNISTVKTDSHGIANFPLPEPPPERIRFLISPDEFVSCSEAEFLTDQILRSGVVGGNACAGKKTKPSSNAAAGQLVIFGKRVTLWQRILSEIP